MSDAYFHASGNKSEWMAALEASRKDQRLRDAVPDLLKALDRAVPYVENAANDCRDTPNEAAHVLDEMVRAIAKAQVQP